MVRFHKATLPVESEPIRSWEWLERASVRLVIDPLRE
jgi:hypothetical protein